MLTQEEARTRVARGAAHLDQVRPGWHDRIDVGTLTLHDSCGCIVGQLIPGTTYGPSFTDGVCALGLNCSDDGGDDGWQRGVTLRMIEIMEDAFNDNVAYRPLQDAWIEAIADRRLKAVAVNAVEIHV